MAPVTLQSNWGMKILQLSCYVPPHTHTHTYSNLFIFFNSMNLRSLYIVKDVYLGGAEEIAQFSVCLAKLKDLSSGL